MTKNEHEDEAEDQDTLEFLPEAVRAGDESGVYEGDAFADLREYIRSLAPGKKSDSE